MNTWELRSAVIQEVPEPATINQITGSAIVEEKSYASYGCGGSDGHQGLTRLSRPVK